MCTAADPCENRQPCQTILIVSALQTTIETVSRAFEMLHAKQPVTSVATWSQAKTLAQESGRVMIIDLRSLAQAERGEVLQLLRSQGIKGIRTFLYDSQNPYGLQETQWADDVFVLYSLEGAYFKGIMRLLI